AVRGPAPSNLQHCRKSGGAARGPPLWCGARSVLVLVVALEEVAHLVDAFGRAPAAHHTDGEARGARRDDGAHARAGAVVLLVVAAVTGPAVGGAVAVPAVGGPVLDQRADPAVDLRDRVGEALVGQCEAGERVVALGEQATALVG